MFVEIPVEEYGKIDWKIQGGQLKKNWYSQHEGIQYFSGKAH